MGDAQKKDRNKSPLIPSWGEFQNIGGWGCLQGPGSQPTPQPLQQRLFVYTPKSRCDLRRGGKRKPPESPGSIINSQEDGKHLIPCCSRPLLALSTEETIRPFAWLCPALISLEEIHVPCAAKPRLRGLSPPRLAVRAKYPKRCNRASLRHVQGSKSLSDQRLKTEQISLQSDPLQVYLDRIPIPFYGEQFVRTPGPR